ncbi:MAG: rhodanese-like domain-containing protein [Gammaproteobacteria bacterium]
MNARFFGLLVAAVIVVAGCRADPGIDTISVSELAAQIGAASAPVILDVRTAREFDAGHVPGAINVPHTEIPDRIEEISAFKNSEVVVYCGSGKRAAMAEADLLAAGFSNIRDLEGHMLEWNAGGFPLQGLPESAEE